MIKKFDETGLIMDSKLPMRHCTGRSLDSITAVSESVAESAGTSLCHTRKKIIKTYLLYIMLDKIELYLFSVSSSPPHK